MPFERNPLPTSKEVTYHEVKQSLTTLTRLIKDLLNLNDRNTLNAAIREMNQLVMLATTYDRQPYDYSKHSILIKLAQPLLRAGLIPTSIATNETQDMFVDIEMNLSTIIQAANVFEEGIDTVKGQILNRAKINWVLEQLEALLT